MSGIAGIFYLDGHPVAPALVKRMTDAIARRGIDEAGHWVQGPVGLGHRMLHTTPESLRETQPFASETGDLCLTLDGRVDNREELRAALTAKGAALRTETDAEMVLRAYECWGEDCPSRIIGDFAFAIWDSPKRQLFCARDALGVRPFYYYRGDTFLAFASDPAALFALPEVARRPNLDALADYLLNNFFDSEPTEFERLFRLRPAHALTISERRFECRQYWDVDPNRTLKLARPEEYQEAFLEVFTRALTSQLRSIGRVGVIFSGGLDSSSILCLIEDLKARGQVTANLRGYSVVFDGQTYDESHYMRSVQERWGTEIHWYRPQPPSPLWGLPEACRTDAQPLGTPLAYIPQSVLCAAGSEGTRVVLGGLGGDDFMDAPVALGAELLRAGHPIQAWRYAAALAKFHSVSFSRAAHHAVFLPLRAMLVPRFLRRAYRAVRPRPAFEWMREPHARAARERLTSEPWYLRGRRFRNAGRRSAYNAIHSGHRVQPVEFWDRLAAASGAIEVRQPFCDRRLVELATAIPDYEMVRGGEPKGLLRAALGSRLPDPIRKRNDKADFATLINQRLIFNDYRAAKALLGAVPLELERLGLVAGDKARKAYDTYRSRYTSRLTAKEAVDRIWELLSLEAWARGVFA